MDKSQLNELKQVERAKYAKMWELDQYRKIAPGEQIAEVAYSHFGSPCDHIKNKSFSLTDFGCGTGRGAQWFKNKGMTVTGIDIAENCLDRDVDIHLVTGCLWDALPNGLGGHFGYCTDVLEHIPEECVGKVLFNILNLTGFRAFMTIAHYADGCGKLLGDDIKLHNTVKPPQWWKERLERVIKTFHEKKGIEFKILSQEPIDNGQTTSILIERVQNG